MVALSHGSRWAEGEAVLRLEGVGWTCQAQTWGEGAREEQGEEERGREGGDGVGVGGERMAGKLWTPDSEGTAPCIV